MICDNSQKINSSNFVNKNMKAFLYSFAFMLVSLASFAQQKEGQLSTHILDISSGQPAPNVEVQLEKYNAENDTWHLISTKKDLSLWANQ